MATATAMRLGDLRERIRIETFSANRWALVGVVSARVLPGPMPVLAPVADPVAAIAQVGNAYTVTLRHRTDLARGMRVRWGASTLFVQYVVEDIDGLRKWSQVTCETFLAYASRHDALIGSVVLNGGPITFSVPESSATSYDSATDTSSSPPNPTLIVGSFQFLDAKGAPVAYTPNTTSETASPVMLFVPATIGQLPGPSATATVAGVDYVVQSVNPIAPDGVPIAAYVTVAR